MQKNTWRRLLRGIRGGELTVFRATGSVYLGLFVGLLPLYGLHLPLCLGLSAWLSLDGLLAYGAANISNPLFAPFIVMLQIEVGSLLIRHSLVAWDLTSIQNLGLAAFTWQSLLGAVVVATVGSTLGATLTLVLGLWLRRRRDARENSPLPTACRQTIARYARAKPKDRHYVRIKLLTDPLTRQLAQLDLSLGNVTDAGCGRGQFGLLLHALGRVRTLYGFDFDAQKVEAATLAAQDLGVYVHADLRQPPLELTDTVLLFDVLHYLDALSQRQLLRRIFECLSPGGHLLLRDVDKNHGPAAFITRACERVGTALGINQSDQLVFRGSEELRAELLAIGFELTAQGGQREGLLDNQLWVFRKPDSTLRAGEQAVVAREEGPSLT